MPENNDPFADDPILNSVDAGVSDTPGIDDSISDPFADDPVLNDSYAVAPENNDSPDFLGSYQKPEQTKYDKKTGNNFFGRLENNIEIAAKNIQRSYYGYKMSEFAGWADSFKRPEYSKENIDKHPKLKAQLQGALDNYLDYAAKYTQVGIDQEKENPQRPALEKITRPQGNRSFIDKAAEIGEGLAEDPLGVIGDLTVQSAPMMIEALATVAAIKGAGGSNRLAALGGGAVSGINEFGSDYAQLRMEGKTHEEAWGAAAVRAGIIGLFDVVSFKTAGSSLEKVVNASLSGKAKTTLKETSKQMGLGAGGELVGTEASGRDAELGDVVAEALGETAGLIIEGPAMLVGKKPKKPKKDNTGNTEPESNTGDDVEAEKNVDDIINDVLAEEEPAGPIDMTGEADTGSREAATNDAAGLQEEETNTDIAPEYDPASDGIGTGELFEQDEYLPEWDNNARALSELHDEAAYYDETSADRVLEVTSDHESAANLLKQIITQGRQTDEETKPAGYSPADIEQGTGEQIPGLPAGAQATDQPGLGQPAVDTGGLAGLSENRPIEPIREPAPAVIPEQQPVNIPAAPVENTAPQFTPTHELSDGTLASPYIDEDNQAQANLWVDADGVITEDNYATPIEAETSIENDPVLTDSKPSARIIESDGDGIVLSATSAVLSALKAANIPLLTNHNGAGLKIANKDRDRAAGVLDLVEKKNPGVKVKNEPVPDISSDVKSESGDVSDTENGNQSVTNKTPSGRRDHSEPVAEEHRQGERRADVDHRKDIETMSDDEKTAEIEKLRVERLQNPKTKIAGRTAFEEDAELGWDHVAALDGDGVGFFNDTIGHDPTDEILKVYASEIEQFNTDTVRFYHLNGDEFAARGENTADLKVQSDKVQKHLEKIILNIDTLLESGERLDVEITGLGISYGIGDSYESADIEATKNKSDRERAGQRAEKGSNPGGIEVANKRSGRKSSLGERGDSKDRALKVIEETGKDSPPGKKHPGLKKPDTTSETKTASDEAVSASGDSKKLSPSDFVPAPNGSINYGEITTEIANEIGRQKGVIRLQNGNKRFGLTHILKRLKQLVDRDYQSVESFVYELASNFDEIRKGDSGRIMLVKKPNDDGRTGDVLIIELQPEVDKDGDYYSAVTGLPMSYKRVEDKYNLLWERGAHRSVDSDNQLPLPTQNQQGRGSAANAQDKSDKQIIAPISNKKHPGKKQTINSVETDSKSVVDEAANEAATSPENNLPEPTEAQKDAGNYQKGHITIQGIDIAIENPAGSKRRPEWPALKHHYGYIKKTEGADGDHVDVFVGDGEKVFIVDQINEDKTFDEHKVMLGFNSKMGATKAYNSNYEKDWKGKGAITEMTMGEFKSWLEGDTTKPVAYKQKLHPGKKKATSKATKKTKPTKSGAQDVAGKPLANTDDVGAELLNNRRQSGLNIDDIRNAENDSQRLVLAQKKKLWERPNYQEMVDNGIIPAIAHTIKQIYDLIPAKPAYKNDEHVYAYVEGVEALRKATDKYLHDKDAQIAVSKAMMQRAEARSRGSFSILDQFGSKDDANNPLDYILDIVFPKNNNGSRWGRNNQEGKTRANALGNRLYKSLSFNLDGFIKALKAVSEDGWPAKQEAWQRSYKVLPKSDAVTSGNIKVRGENDRVLKIRVSVSGRRMEQFDTQEQADAYIEQMPDWYLISKKRGLVDTYETKDKAVDAVRELTRKIKVVKFKEPSVPVEKSKRIGADVRNGENVSTQDVKDVIGFKGINFGNWMKGKGNAKERQAHTNSIYDAVHDLANVLGIPVKAMSLNGMLGVAVGAQGKGKAAAHFVAGINEINITRKSGAGSLAHEWGHALDHYFANLAGLAKNNEPFLSEHSYVKEGDVRPEIVSAFSDIVDTMSRIERDYTKEEIESFRVKTLEADKKKLDAYLERRGAKEPSEKYNSLINRIKKGDIGDTVKLGNSKEYMGEAIDSLRKEHNKITGRLLSLDDARYINFLSSSVNRYSDKDKYFENHPKSVKTTTNYNREARLLDPETGKKYFSTKLEMFARAFEIYVLDKLAENNQKNDYLTSAWKTDEEGLFSEEANKRYPRGVEREKINNAFDVLVNEIKTKETDKGVALFSRSTPKTKAAKSGLSVSGVKKSIGKKLGNQLLNGLINSDSLKVVGSIFDLPFRLQVPGVRGVYDPQTNTSYLVADALTKETAYGVLLHEIGVHHGLEGMLGKKKFEQIKLQLRKGDGISQRIKDAREKVPASTPDAYVDEETLGYLVEDPKNHNMNIVQKIIAAIRAFLFRLGVIKNINTNDIVMMVRAAVNSVARGEKANIDPSAVAEPVYSEQAGQSLFSRGESKESLRDKSELVDQFMNEYEDKTSFMKQQRWGLLTMRQVADVIAKHLPDLKAKFIPEVQRMEITKNKWKDRGGSIAEVRRKLGKEKSEQLSDVQHEATIAGVDPSVNYKPSIDIKSAAKRIKLLEQQGISRPGSPKAKIIAQIKSIKIEIGKEYNRKKKYPDILVMWYRLDSAQQEQFKVERDFHKDLFKAQREALMQRVTDTVENEHVRKGLLDDLKREFENNQVEEPYFPLSRFGDFFVYARDTDGEYTFDLFTSGQAKKRFMKQIAREGAEIIGHGLNMKDYNKITEVDTGFLVAVDDKISALGKHPQIEELRDGIYQMYLKSLPGMSSRKSQIHRKKRKGFHRDQLRGFADAAVHGANALGRLKHGHLLKAELDKAQLILDVAGSKLRVDEINEQIEELEESLEESSSAGKEPAIENKIQALNDLVNSAESIRENDTVDFLAPAVSELRGSFDAMMNPNTSPWASGFNAFGFTWFLGASTSAAIVNLFQTPTIALPLIGAKFGYKNASKHMAGAYKAFTKGKGSIESQLSPAELEAYAFWHDTGLLTTTLSHDLAGISEEGINTGSFKNKFMTVVSWMFHNAEIVNREVTALAAYRAAKAAGRSNTSAMEIAEEITWISHFDYTSGNRARFMRGNTMRVVTQFKQYSQNITYLYAKTINDAFRHETPKVKAEARKALYGILAGQMIVAGGLGMPMASMMMGITQALVESFGDDDEPVEVEAEIRTYLADALGKTGGKFVAKGFFDAFTPFAVHGRLTLSDLWMRTSDADLEGRAHSYDLLKAMLGPQASIFEGLVVGADLMLEGKPQRGIEYMLPKALKDSLKAARYLDEDARTMSGRVIREMGPWEALAKLSGFANSELSDIYSSNTAIQNVKKKRSDRRKQLIDDIIQATEENDSAALSDAQAAIHAWNRKNPQSAITGKSIQRSRRGMMRRSGDMTHGVFVKRSDRDLLDRYDYAEGE